MKINSNCKMSVTQSYIVNLLKCVMNEALMPSQLKSRPGDTQSLAKSSIMNW